MLRAIPPGNLAFGEGCLVCGRPGRVGCLRAGPIVLAAARRRGPGTQAPSLLNLYRLALAQQDAGLTQERAAELYRVQTLAEKTPASRDLWRGLVLERALPMMNRAPQAPILAKPVPFTPTAAPEQAGAWSCPCDKRWSWRKAPLPATCSAGRHGEKVLAMDAGAIFCLDPATGKVWNSKVAVAGVQEATVWLGSFANMALRASTDALTGFDLDDSQGAATWTSVGAGPRVPSCSLRTGAYLPGQSLSHQPIFAGTTVWFISWWTKALAVGARSLDRQIRLAILGTGWADTTARRRRPLQFALPGHGSPCDAANYRRQTPDARQRVGGLLHEGPARRPWTQRPLALDERHFILTEAAGKVLKLDAGQRRHSLDVHAAGRRFADRFAASGVRRQQQALRPGAAQSWQGPGAARSRHRQAALAGPLLPLPGTVIGVACDEEAVYLATSVYSSARCSRRRLLWSTRLPAGVSRWKIRRVALSWWRFRGTIGHCFGCRWALAVHEVFHPPDAGEPRSQASVLLINAQDGQWLERLPPPAGGGPITALVVNDHLVIAAGGKLPAFYGTGR